MGMGTALSLRYSPTCTEIYKSNRTLNSVEWNTPLLLSINNELVQIEIGRYIDEMLKTIDNKDIEKHPNDTLLGWIKNDDVKILSCDKYGKIRWEKVEAVTRHPPQNEDGTNTLLKVTTRSGRSVIATKAKSFLKRVGNEIVQVNGSDIKVGDFLPVSRILPIEKDMKCSVLDVSKYLPKSEWLFMSEVQKALTCLKQEGRHWWKKNKGKYFELPYSRSDAFRETFLDNKSKQVFVEGCVYPKKTTLTVSTIPEEIPLDEEFGFLVGAYLSEGGCTETQLMISNIDEDFLEIIRRNCAKFNLNYHMDVRHINNGLSKTLRIHSTVMTKLFSKAFGKGSSNKKIPAWVLSAPHEFIVGLMNGYFSGDGTLGKVGEYIKTRNTISATSTSKSMLETLQQLLLRYDITSWISFHDTKKYEQKRTNFTSVQDAWKLNISCGNTKKFAQVFKFIIKAKQIKLENLQCVNEVYEYSKFDIVPDVKLTKKFMKSIHRDKVANLITKTTDKDDIRVLQQILNEDIYYDEVISIEECESEHDKVYDLTVENTRNFNILNGLAMADTFHLSGVSSASKGVRGVPRIEELTRVTKNVKTPSMTVYIRPEYNQDKEKSIEIKNELEITTFKEIIKSSRIYFDKEDFNTEIENDVEFVKLYKDYQLEDDDDKNKNREVSPWLLRMELDKAKMLDQGLTMIDLHHTLYASYNNRISCMFSDDNAADLIFRIRIFEDTVDNKNDILTELKALESTIIENVMIKGIEKVSKVELVKKDQFKYNDVSKVFEKIYEWIMYTDGTNLLETLGYPYIDSYKTVSNDVNEIYSIFGIEAARQCLYNELYSVIKDAEASVSFRHLSLLVDTMTHKGHLMSIDRHGINKGDIGPLAKCSFEEVNDVLIKAGVFSELDRVNGVSSNIILGQIAPCGTGDTQILIDEQKLLPPKEKAVFQQKQHFMEDTEVCAIDNLTFDFTLPDMDETIEQKQDIAVKFV
jgi:intein/homing endonuclease